jgi:hypothetical protein
VNHKAVLDDLLLTFPDVQAAVVFGLPCYKVGAGVFATLCEDGVGIKLPLLRASDLLKKPGFAPFQPFSRNRGKEFVQINHDDSEDYRQDLLLFEESMNYVLSATPKPKVMVADPHKADSGNEEDLFRTIGDMFLLENHAVTLGKMMSSPGIQYRGKVFAFYHDTKMIFKLGRDFRPESFGIQQYSLLAPFKTKPPMIDWFVFPPTEKHRWEELARLALQRISAD